MDYKLILIGSGSLVCLMPLAIYLLYLSHLNGRTPPTLVRGPWDFAAVLLAVSGFLVLAGPLLVTLLDATWRAVAFGGWADLRSVSRREAMAGSLMAVGYLILLGTGIVFVLRLRRPTTAIYNVDSASVEPGLTAVLEHRSLPWRRVHGRFEIDVRPPTDPAAAPRFFPHETATVRVFTFPATGHATLRWGGESDGVRHDVETDLPTALAPHRGGRNPVAGWMFTAAVSIMVVMLLWLVVLIYIVMIPGRG